MKIQLQEDELKYCTFQPNVDKKESNSNRPKNIKETINKLYQDGVTKCKSKKNDDNKIKDTINASDCTFVPKVNPL